jgi:uncharacterized protein YbjT (DUF2867 family)
MKITVFGATGATGRIFTALALEAGHELTVLVRDASKLTGAHNAKLCVVTGDATDKKAVAEVVNGADAVVSCLGHVAGEAPMMTTAFDNILSASSNQATPPRCVLITTIGVGGTSQFVKLVLSTLVAGCRVIADYEEADRLVQRSGVPYVLVRPGNLLDGPSKGNYTASLKGFYHIAMKITRADVAKFLLRAASSSEFENKAVQLYN